MLRSSLIIMWKERIFASWSRVGWRWWCLATSKLNCLLYRHRKKPAAHKLKLYSCEENRKGDFYAGLDLAQTKDYSVLAVIESLNDKLYLRHLKIFGHPTLYASVLGYIKNLQDHWGGFIKIRVDFTREGPSIISEMQNSGIDNAEGRVFLVCLVRVRWRVCLSNVWLIINFIILCWVGSVLTGVKSAMNLTLNATCYVKTPP